MRSRKGAEEEKSFRKLYQKSMAHVKENNKDPSSHWTQTAHSQKLLEEHRKARYSISTNAHLFEGIKRLNKREQQHLSSAIISPVSWHLIYTLCKHIYKFMRNTFHNYNTRSLLLVCVEFRCGIHVARDFIAIFFINVH